MMKYWKTSILAISLTSLIGCGGGSGGGSSSTGGNTPTVQNLSKTTLIYSQSIEINKELKISIEDNTETVTTDYSWEVISAPASSNLLLTESSDSKSVSMTPTIAGKYKIRATPATGEAIDTQFSIEKDLPFNASKLKGYDATQELSKQLGIVSNQAWIYSETLNQAAIDTIVSNFQGFNIIDYDEVRGLLVEFNETLAQSQVDLKKIKETNGIDDVDLRVFAGQDVNYLAEKTANDGSDFDDGGDNWHLEHIGIENAWNISTGNNEFNIGISESYASFHTQHEDLRGRFKEAIKATEDSAGISHATGIAGTIGAVTNNNKGISGINWSNQLIGGGPGYSGLKQIISRDDVLLVNASWSMLVTGIPDAFDPTNADEVEIIDDISLSLTRDYRKLATEYSNKLFVVSAGNGIISTTDNGVFGVDGRHGDPALHYKEQGGEVVLAKKPNVLFVASHLIDNKLVHSSLYGESIDIAAPTRFKSTKNDSSSLESFEERDTYYISDDYGNNKAGSGGSFSGTSASTAVVTGVASLILAVDQELTASNVKSILINSATGFVTERYKAPSDEIAVTENGNTGPISNIQSLTHPIPILNAAAALSMTKEIKDGREIKGEYIFSDPFSPTLGFNLLPANEKLKLDSYTYRFSALETGASVNYVELASGSVTGLNPLLIQNIGINKTHHKMEVVGALFTHEASKVSFTTNLDYQFVIPMVTAISIDKNTQAKIPNVTLEIKPEDGTFPTASGSTDASGNVRLYFAPGKYKIIAKANGYEDFKKDIEVDGTETNLDIRLEMTSSTMNPNPSGEMGRLNPITPLTSTETTTNTGNNPSTTFVYESGFEGDIEAITRPVESGPFAFYDQVIQLKAGKTSIKIVDVQRDTGVEVICTDGRNSYEIINADFTSGIVTDTGSLNNGQTQSCSSTYQTVVPATVSDDEGELELLVKWWATDNRLSNASETGLINTDCPEINGVDTTLGNCSANMLTNYLITDDTGKEHMVSTRLVISN